MSSSQLKYAEITDQVLKAFYRVYNALGYGFLEKVYENALAIELRRMGLDIEQQKAITVYYEDEPVGDYFADIIVEGKVLLELKAAECIGLAHEAQLLNYLKATHVPVGLVLNFGPKPTFIRRAF